MASNLPAEVLPGRTVPHSAEAEMSVLGAMILDSDAAGEVIEIIDAEAFHEPRHRLIYDALVDLFLTRRKLDLVTLKAELERRGSIEVIGGIEYCESLVVQVPTSAHAAEYARIIRDKAILRQLLRTCESVIREVREGGEDPDKLLDRAQSLVFEVAAKRGAQPVEKLSEILKRTFQQIADIHDRKARLLGLSTGFYELDDLLSGLQPSHLYIVAGRPSMGKSSLAMKMAEHVAVELKKPVLFFSLEMAASQIAQQMLCSHCRVDSHRLRTGLLAENEYQKLNLGAGALAEAPILIDDSADLSILEVRARARRQKAEHPDLGLVIIDYLQKVHAKSESREREIAVISSQLKSLAKELEIPVICLAQLNRRPEGREGNLPQLSDLRESGAIEQDADVVMLLYREDYYNRETDQKNTCDVIVAKNRTGPTDSVKLAFIKEYTRFENLAVQPQG
ncbi:MAG TPA: replicative DNA helicase [Candidatus Eisenbacteria bacterium]|nr:replicative DNA helicase [Candidatus Eisenbacteria bacterium]